MFRELGKLLAILAVFLVGIITVMLTYQSLIGLAVFMGILASSAAALSLSLIITFWAITLLVSAATMLQSAPGIWSKFTNWGQFVDNKVCEWRTGEEYYIDKASRLIKESHKLAHSAQYDINIKKFELLLKPNDLKHDKLEQPIKPSIDPRNDKLWEKLVKLQSELKDDQLKNTPTDTKLLKAFVKLTKARNLLIKNTVLDPQERARDEKAGDATFEANNKIGSLLTDIDRIEDKAKKLARQSIGSTKIEAVNQNIVNKNQLVV